jgi:hypothetical protein
VSDDCPDYPLSNVTNRVMSDLTPVATSRFGNLVAEAVIKQA